MRGRLLLLVPKSPIMDLFKDIRPDDKEVTIQVSKKSNAQVALQQGLALFSPQELIQAFNIIPATTKILHLNKLNLSKFTSRVLYQILSAIPMTVEVLDLSENGFGFSDAEGLRGESLHIFFAAIVATTVDLSANYLGGILSHDLSTALSKLQCVNKIILNNNGLLAGEMTVMSDVCSALMPSVTTLEIIEDNLEYEVAEDKSMQETLLSTLNSFAKAVPMDMTVKLNDKYMTYFADLRKSHAQTAASNNAEERKFKAEKAVIAQLLAYMVFARKRAEAPATKNPFMHWAHHSAVSLEKVSEAINKLAASTSLVDAADIIAELLRRHDELKPSYPLSYVMSNGKGAGLHTNSFDTIFLQLLYSDNKESDKYKSCLLDLTPEELKLYELTPFEDSEDYRNGTTAELLSGPKRLPALERNGFREKAITQLATIVEVFHPGTKMRKQLNMV
jgi:hypothetical protein